MSEKNLISPYVGFFDVAVNKNELWFCNVNYNMLFRLDMSSRKLETVIELTDIEKFGLAEEYSALAYYQNKLIIAPKNAKDIILYDIAQKEIKHILFELPKDKEIHSNYFRHVEVYRNVAYLFPGTYPAILKLDLDTYKVSYIDEWYHTWNKQLTHQETDKAMFLNFHIDGTDCYMPCRRVGLEMRFNLQTEKCEMKQLGEFNMQLTDSLHSERTVWYSHMDGNEIYQIVDGVERCYTCSDCNCHLEGGYHFVDAGKNIYAIPRIGNAFLQINKKTKNINITQETIDQPKEYMKNFTIYKTKYICRQRYDHNKMLFFSNYEGLVIIRDLENGNIDSYETKLSEEQLSAINKLYQEYLLKKSDVIYEDKVSLEAFLTMIDKYNTVEMRIEESVGSKIYKLLIKEN